MSCPGFSLTPRLSPSPAGPAGLHTPPPFFCAQPHCPVKPTLPRELVFRHGGKGYFCSCSPKPLGAERPRSAEGEDLLSRALGGVQPFPKP